MDLKTHLSSRSSDAFSGTKFCISVDGSKYSDYGFELIFNDMFKRGDRIVVAHISNSEKMDQIPFNYLPDTIQNKYETKLIGKLLKSDYSLVVQPKEKKVSHAMEQVFKICNQNRCDVLVMGYQGHKADHHKKDITKGTVFMIENVHIPTFIVKDDITRTKKTDGSFSWLIGIENSNSKSFKAFEYSLKFMDLQKDRIVILHIKQFKEREEELIENEIKNFCVKNKIENADIKLVENDGTSIGTQINSFINYGEVNFDFVVIGHNCEKYKNLESSPIIEICKTAQVNILYYCKEDSKMYENRLEL